MFTGNLQALHRGSVVAECELENRWGCKCWRVLRLPRWDKNLLCLRILRLCSILSNRQWFNLIHYRLHFPFVKIIIFRCLIYWHLLRLLTLFRLIIIYFHIQVFLKNSVIACGYFLPCWFGNFLSWYKSIVSSYRAWPSFYLPLNFWPFLGAILLSFFK